LLEASITHADSCSWGQWSLKLLSSAWTHCSNWLDELFSLLEVVTLEIGDWNLVATNVFVHGCIPVIILAWLCHLLRDHVVHKNWLLLRHLLSDELAVDLVLLLTSTRARIIILLLLHALDLLKLLLELISLLVDVLVQYLLVLLDLVNDVLLVPHVHKILLIFSRAYLRVDTCVVVSNSITAEEARTLVAG
jgi:hypothetical protein